MFTWLNKQGVKSEKGFIVQVVSRFVIEYREGLKIVSVEIEPGFLPDKKICINIATNAFEKWDDGVSVSKEKQAEMLQNFKEAMKFQGIAVLVD